MEISNDPTSLNAPINIGELANMFRKKVSVNERPLDAAVIQLNNKIVDDWHEKVLKKIADPNGCIPVGRATPCFLYYLEGYEIYKMRQYKDRMPVFSEENAKYWVKKFEDSPVDELYDLGTNVISRGWAYIKGYIKNHFTDLKWDKVYSESEDPHIWDKLANDNPNVMNARPLPLGLTKERLSDIEMRTSLILAYSPQPKNEKIDMKTLIDKADFKREFKRKILKNDRPLDAKIMALTNNRVERWADKVLPTILDKNKKVTRTDAYAAFFHHLEGCDTTAYQKYRDKLYTPTEENVKFWLDFLKDKDIKFLNEKGTTVISVAWGDISNYLQDTFSEIKYKHVYSRPEVEDGDTWKTSKGWQEINKIDKLPFDLQDKELGDMSLNVKVIMNNLISPR